METKNIRNLNDKTLCQNHNDLPIIVRSSEPPTPGAEIPSLIVLIFCSSFLLLNTLIVAWLSHKTSYSSSNVVLLAVTTLVPVNATLFVLDFFFIFLFWFR